MLGFYTNMQNNILNNTNISFKSNIRFIPYKNYRELADAPKIEVVREMWHMGHVKEVVNRGATEGIQYCLAGIMNNIKEKRDFIFHWWPDLLYNSKGKKFEHLIEIGKTLKNLAQKEKLKGLVIGGTSKMCDFDKSQYSLKLLNYLKKSIKMSDKKDFTIFFSQNSKNADFIFPETAFVYKKNNDTYYVNCRDVDDSKEGLFDLLNKNEIRDHFGLIHIAGGDKIFLGLDSQEQIPNEFWNKNRFAKDAKKRGCKDA